MVQIHFPYRIKKEAGWAHDQQGNDTDLYAKITLNMDKELGPEKYEELSQAVKKFLAGQMDVEPALFELISMDEYRKEHSEIHESEEGD